jgi:hypothetical protein
MPVISRRHGFRELNRPVPAGDARLALGFASGLDEDGTAAFPEGREVDFAIA